MRLTTLVLALAGAIFMTGCSSLVSLNSFVTDKEACLEPALLGVWHDSDDATYIIRQSGNVYAIAYMDKSSSVIKFEARLLGVGDAKLLDLVSKNDDPFQIPAHTPMRVWPEGSTLRMAFLDSEWLRQEATQQLPAQMTGDRLVITAPGDAVRTFLTTYGADDRAYGEPSVLRKVQ